MKIVIAPDAFKESMTALEAAEHIEKGFAKVFPDAEYIKIPMADGGEGTVRSLTDATGGEIHGKTVTGPLGVPVDAFYGLSGDGNTAVIEMAAASGIHLVPEEKRNPLITTTRGTGELMLEAVKQGARHIIIGLGGSATNDGGAGMAQALGVKLLDAHGKQIGNGGGNLHQLNTIDITEVVPDLRQVHIEAACDVDNPLTGTHGASYIFGPQKGADRKMVMALDQNLMHFSSLLRRDLGKDVDQVPGAGAAGGIGAGLLAFLNAELKRGVSIVIEAVQLDKHVADADLVITGEGKIDRQTIYGKTPVGVAETAKKYRVPVIAIAGSIGESSEAVYEYGIDAVFSLVPGAVPLADAMENAKEYIGKQAENIARLVKLSRGI
jgi:glycerate kinase